MKKAIREKVYKKFNGRCAYCGQELPKKWHVDHFEPILRTWSEPNLKAYNERAKKPILRGQDNFDNYMPSCPQCNLLKSSMSIESFRRTISNFINSLNLYSRQYQFAKKYGLLKETPMEVKFYYEQFSDHKISSAAALSTDEETDNLEPNGKK